jgi:hypothetical protein
MEQLDNLYSTFSEFNNPDSDNIVWIDGCLVQYSQDEKHLLRAVGNIENYFIKEGTTRICRGAFSDCISLKSLVIPNSVTFIDDYAFQGCENLKTIIIPSGVKAIGKHAFEGCSKLANIEISNTIESIGERAFGCCHALEKITIPESVKLLGDGVFDGCVSLKTIVFEGVVEKIGSISGWMQFGKYGPIYGEYLYGDDWEKEMREYGYDIDYFDEERLEYKLEKERRRWRNLKILIPFGKEVHYVNLLNYYHFMITRDPFDVHNYSLIATNEDVENGVEDDCGVVYSIDGERLLKCRNKTIGKYSIKEGTTIICNEAFSCSSLTDIHIPNSVICIGKNAFERCKLTEIHLPDSVWLIEEKAFYMCKFLHKIFISGSVTHIGEHAFLFCRHIESIYVDPKNNNFDSRNNCNAIIETNANTLVIGCASTIIPDSVTHIGNGAFACQRSLSSIQIPKSVVHIGNAAFFECYALSDIYIPESVTYIGYNAFTGCYNVRSILVDKNNKHYDSRNDCNAIIDTNNNLLIRGCDSTVIPESITHIGNAAFSCCSFSKIHIPASVIHIGDYAFEFCKNLCEIIIPKSVTHMGKYVFECCESLSQIIVPIGSRSKTEKMLQPSLKSKIIEKANADVVITNSKLNVLNGNTINNFKKKNGEFAGSYAQDVMGYSDEDIYDAFEGDPDAYWNID